MNAVPARSPISGAIKVKVIAAATPVPHVVQTNDLLNAVPGPRPGTPATPFYHHQPTWRCRKRQSTERPGASRGVVA
jgi:hypothetical protein